MSDQDNDRAVSTGISRRHVVKVGAHAAWAVPVVTVLASTPAFAANSPTTTLTATGFQATRNGATLTVTITINNTGPVATSGLKATVTITPIVGDFGQTTTTTGGAPSVNGTAISYVYALPEVAAGQSSGVLTAVYTLAPTPGPGTVTITAVADNAAQVSPTPPTTPFL